jgi:hypothetical protein
MNTRPTFDIERWRERPCEFIEECLYDPMTGKPFVLFPAQRQFFEHAWKLDSNGRLLYPEQRFCAPKASGKTGMGGLHLLTTTCLFGGRYSDSVVVSNSLEQAQTRGFQQIARIVAASPLLRHEADITSTRIKLPEQTITAIPANDASAAGLHATESWIDEVHGFKTESANRLWAELVPPPTRKIACRLVTSYASYRGECQLLEDIYASGMSLPEIAPSLRAGNGTLFAWHHSPIAPWQDDAWLQRMRASLTPQQYQRLIENQIVGSEDSLITPQNLDSITDDQLGHANDNQGLIAVCGVDGSLHTDQTAIVVVGYDPRDESVRLLDHYIFKPTHANPISFAAIENVILQYYVKFKLRAVYLDPHELQSTIERLKWRYVPVTAVPPTASNNVQMASTLLHMVKHQKLTLYKDADIRQSLLDTNITEEGGRGLKLTKRIRSARIDATVALSLACLAATRSQSISTYETNYAKWNGPADDQTVRDNFQRQAKNSYLLSGGLIDIRRGIW